LQALWEKFDVFDGVGDFRVCSAVSAAATAKANKSVRAANSGNV